MDYGVTIKQVCGDAQSRFARGALVATAWRPAWALLLLIRP